MTSGGSEDEFLSPPNDAEEVSEGVVGGADDVRGDVPHDAGAAVEGEQDGSEGEGVAAQQDPESASVMQEVQDAEKLYREEVCTRTSRV